MVEVMIITTARGSPAGMFWDPVVVDQLLAGQVPLDPPVQLLVTGCAVIRSTSAQMMACRRLPGVVCTQSCWLVFGQGGPGGVPHVFRVLMKRGLSGGLKWGFPGPQP